MYYRAWTVVLAHIKTRFMEVTGLTEEAFYNKHEINAVQEIYWLRRMDDNLIRKMAPVHNKEFSAGKSILPNLHYLASSHAMAFNMLGNETLTVLKNPYQIPDGNYRISYNKTFRALKSKNAFVNMDACLWSEDGGVCLCLEMKMLEWFVFKINPIKDTFMKAENYYYPDTAPVFMDVIKLLIPFLNRDEWEHFSCFQNYDGLLIMRQLLGLYNSIRMASEYAGFGAVGDNRRSAGLKELILATVYWKASDPGCYENYRERILAAEEQMKGETRFLQELAGPVRELFEKELGIRLRLVNLSNKELLRILEKTDEEKNLLRRYDV